MKKQLQTAMALVAILATTQSMAQSNPATFNLGGGNYSFSQWDSLSAAGSYPANIVFHTVATTDAPLATEPDSDWQCKYNITSRSRFSGEGANGFSFLNTSNLQDTDVRCGGAAGVTGSYISDATLGLNATGRQNVTVSFKSILVTQGDANSLTTPREYNLVLLFKIGTGAWNNVSGTTPFSNIGRVSGDSQTYTDIILPSTANNQSQVYLRWKYAFIAANDGGSRPRIAVDEISVNSDIATGFEPIYAENNLVVFQSNDNTFQLTSESEIQITDLNGKVMLAKQNTKSFSTHGWAAGLYILKGEKVGIIKFAVN